MSNEAITSVQSSEKTGNEVICKRLWLKGDTHMHTFNSDGKLSPQELVKRAKKRGLDWIIITDHNNNTAGKLRFDESGLTVIQGIELTNKLGHMNFWGVEAPFDAPYDFNSFEEFLPFVSTGKERGATVSVNHPTCKKCGWHMPLEGFPIDCVEVWNAPMRIDNMTAIDWWHGELLKGRRISAVGGSDYHRDYYVTKLIALPTTITFACSDSPEDILAALRNGNTIITHGPNSTMLYLTCGDKIVGETVEWHKGIKVRLDARKVMPGHKITVYNNDKIIFEQKMKTGGNKTVELEVPEKGFVRAQATFVRGIIGKFIYQKIVTKELPGDVGLPLPPFAWCLTNPIFFE